MKEKVEVQHVRIGFPIDGELYSRLVRIADLRGGVKMNRLYATALREWTDAQDAAHAEELRGSNGHGALREDRPRGKS